MDYAQANKMFKYDPKTGAITRRVVGGNNKSKAGEPAFATPTGHGYLRGEICLAGKRLVFYSHRVAYLLQTGEWPDQIDHINGRRDDNRWLNLRNVGHRANTKNRRQPSTNTSGTIGVTWHKCKANWRAYITVSGTIIHLGSFADKAGAIAARKEAEVRHGFHPNHGDADRPNYKKWRANV